MEEHPPSYQEAVGPYDIIAIIAPYVFPSDYNAACLVNKHMHSHFAPLLWKDPIRMIRTLGLKRDNEIFWLRKFLIRITTVRDSTLAMIYTLDFRGFATFGKEMLGMFDSDSNISNALQRLSGKLPNLRCLVLDGHDIKEIPKSSLSFPRLNVLSMRNCQQRLPPQPFDAESLYSVVYLDLSHSDAGSSSSVNVLVPYRVDLERCSMPELRVLKLQGRKMNVETARWVVSRFAGRLWSLDLSSNPLLGDELIDLLESLHMLGEPDKRLQTDAHFDVEGKVKLTASRVPGRSWTVEESAHSANFSHPDRYFADPPVYQAEYEDRGHDQDQTAKSRLSGTERVRSDCFDDVLPIFDGGPRRPAPWAPTMPTPGGLTHLHLNNLKVSTARVERLLATSNGKLEHLALSQARCVASPTIFGVPGLAYVFRPVLSSNLRALKIHHSLVTNVPSSSSSTCSEALERLHYAETILRQRADLAFPQTWIPDMNPRLHSLTLSKLPRYSFTTGDGSLIERLLRFLRLAALQERAIERTRGGAIGRDGPAVLRGLRHIRLEFDDDGAVEEFRALEADRDAAAAMEEFSMFSESAWGESSKLNTHKKKKGKQPSRSSSPSSSTTTITTTRYTTGLYKDHHEHTLAGSRVWIGSGIRSAENPPAVNAYMRILSSVTTVDDSSLQPILPATPAHVAAGAPRGELLFHGAWARILVPEEEEEEEAAASFSPEQVRDVLEEIKKFRLATREAFVRGEGEEYWKGRLEIEVSRRRE